MTNRHIVDRKLPERTHLTFYFPEPSEGNNYYVVRLPFFENVKIRESKKARYKKYSLVSRSSNLYSYLGADSRVFDLTFNLSLPHILEEHPALNPDRFMRYVTDPSNKDAERNRFKVPYEGRNVHQGLAYKFGNQYTKIHAKDSAKQVINNLSVSGRDLVNPETLAYLETRYGFGAQAVAENVKSETTILGKVGAFFGSQIDILQDTLSDNLKARAIDLIIYWVNIIRSSLVNNAQNPIYGPPYIRLQHGIMYQNVPCICTNYSIDFNEAAGYDIDTLLPRQIRINMKLEEFRTGNFGEFKPSSSNKPRTGSVLESDNLAGWEAVVLGETNSMDPGVIY